MAGAVILILAGQLLILGYSMFIAGGKGTIHKIHAGCVIGLSASIPVTMIVLFPAIHALYVIQIGITGLTFFILYKYYGRKNT
ncbi:hypothetical protein [Pseudoalteromonas sp. SG44-8]|uniref:hypothetical protein n=1 Tax=Pseudoalteromonas sp. SG44-8 TaxID=2760958 RepID=UPI001602FBA7|nr:hypothetical protein [Pseudoalteromonas sp. SG44-8]MBB1398761.1 hypothetical protein [Pseudoalteromonas sp. SG44-8]